MFDTDYFIQKIGALNIINAKNDNYSFEYKSNLEKGVTFNISISKREIYIKTNTFFHSHESSNDANYDNGDKEIIDYYVELCQNLISGKARIREIQLGQKTIKAHLEFFIENDWKLIETIGKIHFNILAKTDEKIFHNMVY